MYGGVIRCRKYCIILTVYGIALLLKTESRMYVLFTLVTEVYVSKLKINLLDMRQSKLRDNEKL